MCAGTSPWHFYSGRGIEKWGGRDWAKPAWVTWSLQRIQRAQLQVTKSQGCSVRLFKELGKRSSFFLSYFNKLWCNSNLKYSLASSSFSWLYGQLLTATHKNQALEKDFLTTHHLMTVIRGKSAWYCVLEEKWLQKLDICTLRVRTIILCLMPKFRFAYIMKLIMVKLCLMCEMDTHS